MDVVVPLAEAEILSGEWLRSHGVAILVTLAIAVGLSLLARLAVRRLGRRMEAATADAAAPGGLRRAGTITHTLLNLVLAVIWTLTVLIVLDQFGVSLAPLIAGAGIAGIALGFGAQSLVRDGLSGFFILLEGQFDLGDTIEAHTTAGLISGRVEGFTLRITSVRAFDGTLHYVPNGNVQVISNKTRGWARAIVDARVAYDEDVDRVRGVLEELFGELREQEPFREALRSGPDVLGLQTMAADALVVRVVAETLPPRRAQIERLLRERIAARFTERGVRVPLAPAAAPRPETPGP